MNSFTRKNTILFVVSFAVVLLTQGAAAAPQTPNPILVFIGPEHVQVAGTATIRYRYAVDNKSQFPADMFAAAPSLPPCGQNTKSSRTWIDLYDSRGKRLQGFCGLTKPEDLDKVWFSLDATEVPPSWVYIEFNDRQANKKYKSNLAETTQ